MSAFSLTTNLTRVAALFVCVLLLAVPTVWACGELGQMSSRCEMGEMAGPMDMGCESGCDSGQMSDGCCDIRSAPEPTQPSSLENTKLLTALEVSDLPVAEPDREIALSPTFLSADAFHLHDLGRYTLYSSFLL